MFWCVVSPYIFTRCLYFDSPYRTAQLVNVYSDTTHQEKKTSLDSDWLLW